MAKALVNVQGHTRSRARVVPLGFRERRALLLLGDVLVLLAAMVGSWVLWGAVGGTVRGAGSPLRPWWLGGLAVGWLILWAVSGGYDLRVASRQHLTNRRLLVTAVVLGGTYLAAFFLLAVPAVALPVWPVGHGGLPLPRLAPSFFIVLALVGELAWRSVYPRLFSTQRFARRALVVGAGRAGQMVLEALQEHGDGSYQVIGFVDDDPAKQGQVVTCGRGSAGVAEPRPRVLGDRRVLRDLIVQHGVTTLVLAVTHEVDGNLLPALLDCLELGVEIVPMAVLYEQLTGRVPAEHIGESWYVAMPIDHPGTGVAWPAVKRMMDVLLAGVGLALFGVALPFIALAICLDSPGPIFYTQERVGKGGRVFRAYKLRSMVPNAENGGAVWAQRNDPRVTRVGRILRKAHIDEFPQFLNILKGEMSAVGPRPERPEFVEELAREIPFYRVRHAVKPGMAGWGLIKQGYGASKEDALLKLQYDLYYIKHQSLWLDVVILLRTVVDTLTLRGR